MGCIAHRDKEAMVTLMTSSLRHDASASAADSTSSQVDKKRTTSFRIVDILSPSCSRHSSGDVTPQSHVTSTRKPTTSSDIAEDGGGGGKCAGVDDIIAGSRQEAMTSGTSALSRLAQLTYSSADDDFDDVIRRHHHRHRHRHRHHHHRPG